jgi:uncharacterized protein
VGWQRDHRALHSYSGCRVGGPGFGGASVGAGVTGRRDRDASGRARQQRPRDALGRPLPYGTTGVDPVSEDPLPPWRPWTWPGSWYDRADPSPPTRSSRPGWKAGPDRERDLWQGLAQVCVRLTHAASGNTIGATRLLERGAARIDAYAAGGGPAYGLDLRAVAECAAQNTAPLADGRVVVTEALLRRPRLVGFQAHKGGQERAFARWARTHLLPKDSPSSEALCGPTSAPPLAPAARRPGVLPELPVTPDAKP